uniref:Si:ch73-173p19.1 n=1 Tax=Cyprinus carpio carpio TaxID=630221 RepID=A0A9J8CTA5_CYPCA
MDSTSTIGGFVSTLTEMGFSEAQIQVAMQAGFFSVPEAAEWLLQGGSPRHKLVKQPSGPLETAFSAFNPPKDALCSNNNSQSDETGPSLVLVQPSVNSPTAKEHPPLETRIKQDKSNFHEQQRQRVAQEVRAEKRQKKQERELVLKRIAEDRRSQQEKNQNEATAETSPSSGQGQRLGGRVETSLDNHCILMIRLPSGESMRERFPADTPLSHVVEYIAGRHPSLPAFSLLQGFPRKRFGETELTCSLRSLGLTPNAALCIQTTPPETPQDPPSPASRLAVVGEAEAEPQEELVAPPNEQPQVEARALEELEIPPPLPHQLWEEAVGYAGIPGVGPPLSGPSHYWGQGQKLVPGDAENEEPLENEEQPEDVVVPPFNLNGLPQLPFFLENRGRAGLEPRHHWPEQGNRLREAEPDDPADPEEGRALRGAAGQAAVERLQRAAHHDEQPSQHGHPSPPKKAFKTPRVPPLCSMATRATVSLMTAPSMQYSSSLACLTPELAELLLTHMARERLLRPRTLELFFGCPLQKFVLNCYPYTTNELLRQLRAFSCLKHLSFVNSPLITDAGLSVLSNLSKLQHLNLSSCNKLTDSCLQHIAGLRSLTFLALDQTKVSDAGLLMYLQSGSLALCQLSLNHTAITENTLRALPTCVPQLRMLSIKYTKVSDVSALAELRSLQTLHLDGSGVRENTLQCLATHPSLSALSLAGIPVADGNHTLEIISGLRLTQLTLPGRHSVTDLGLSFLSRQSLLLELDLTDYTHLSDHGITQLSSMTRLKKLSLSNTQVSDSGLQGLISLKELQELCLDRTAVTSRGVAALITHLPHLQVMGLASTQVGDTVIRRGLVHCPQLLKLNLSRTRITDQGLKFLCRMQLSQVNLDGTGVTLVGIANLISACPQLTSVRASHTRAIPPDQQSDDEGDDDNGSNATRS